MKVSTVATDCTCNGEHTANADGISTADLRILRTMEECPAERRALTRIIAGRERAL